jgi:hypothetical protein
VGLFSSRRIAAGLEDLIALRYLSGGNRPSHRTISRFRQENIERFETIFVDVVRVAKRAGLLRLGTVAIDGTKIQANASKHKAMSYGRMKDEDERLRGEIKRLTEIARGVDEAEDKEFGPDFRGDEVPAELQRRKDRKAKIRQAMKELEEEQALADKEAKRGEPSEKTGQVRKLKRKNGTPPDKAQKNFTDPESRIMVTGRKSFEQCYNAQAAVDEKAQIVVAVDVSARGGRGEEELQAEAQARAGRHGIPLGSQLPRAGAARYRWLCGAWSWRISARSCEQGSASDTADGAQAAHEARTSSLQEAEGHRRARLRLGQTRNGLPRLPAPRCPQGPR